MLYIYIYIQSQELDVSNVRLIVVHSPQETSKQANETRRDKHIQESISV